MMLLTVDLFSCRVREMSTRLRPPCFQISWATREVFALRWKTLLLAGIYLILSWLVFSLNKLTLTSENPSVNKQFLFFTFHPTSEYKTKKKVANHLFLLTNLKEHTCAFQSTYLCSVSLTAPLPLTREAKASRTLSFRGEEYRLKPKIASFSMRGFSVESKGPWSPRDTE